MTLYDVIESNEYLIFILAKLQLFERAFIRTQYIMNPTGVSEKTRQDIEHIM